MITPWEIYWVLQLDSIGRTLFAAAFLAGGCIAISAFMWAMLSDLGNTSLATIFKRLTIYILPPVFVVAFIANALVPSTKTAAVMIVVPQIVNSPTIKHEAGDLYNLAKEALRDAIAPKPERKQ